MSTTPVTPTPDGKPAAPNPILEAIRNPLARTYALVSAGGLLAACAIVYLVLNSVFGAVALLVIGLTGLALRWSSAPVLFVLAVSGLLAFESGLPSVNQIPDSHFRYADLLFVTAALVHLIGLYRYFTAVHIGMPFEAAKAFVKPGVKATVRPAEPVSDPELWRLFARAAIFVIAGQLVWLAVNRVKVDFLRNFPLALYESGFEIEMRGTTDHPFRDRFGQFALPVWLSRFLVSVGFFGTLAAVCGFVFWYWRLAQLNRDEGRLAVLDTSWATHRRDLNRPEAWRGWTKRKLAGTLPKKGCGAYFLVVGLPLLLTLLYVILVGCAGGFR